MGVFDLVNKDKNGIMEETGRKCSFCGRTMSPSEPGYLASGKLKCQECFNKSKASTQAQNPDRVCCVCGRILGDTVASRTLSGKHYCVDCWHKQLKGNANNRRREDEEWVYSAIERHKKVIVMFEDHKSLMDNMMQRVVPTNTSPNQMHKSIFYRIIRFYGFEGKTLPADIQVMLDNDNLSKDESVQLYFKLASLIETVMKSCDKIKMLCYILDCDDNEISVFWFVLSYYVMILQPEQRKATEYYLSFMEKELKYRKLFPDEEDVDDVYDEVEEDDVSAEDDALIENGTFTYSDSRSWTGERKNGMPWNGCGTIIYDDGCVYEGNVLNGKLNSNGTFTLKDGRVYKGEFKDDRFNGNGTLIFEDGCEYTGEFKDGNFNGNGSLTLKNGSVYTGEFKDGEYNGTGTLTFEDGGVYTGEFKDGNFNGNGTLTLKDGGVYTGEFKDSNFNGNGTLTLKDGRVYKGEFKNGKYNGNGTFTYPDGRSWTGEWKDGKQLKK